MDKLEQRVQDIEKKVAALEEQVQAQPKSITINTNFENETNPEQTQKTIECMVTAIRNLLKDSGLTVKQVLELLDKSKSEIMWNMPIKENLNSQLTW